MTDKIPAEVRIMALLSPPSQEVYLTVEDARWIRDEIERLRNVIAHIRRVYTPNGELAQLCNDALESDK